MALGIVSLSRIALLEATIHGLSEETHGAVIAKLWLMVAAILNPAFFFSNALNTPVHIQTTYLLSLFCWTVILKQLGFRSLSKDINANKKHHEQH